jgi:hypothetical protein
VLDTISIENLHKPAVGLCNEDFMIDAASAASSRGMPGIRILASTVPCECTVAEDIEAGITAALIDDIIDALTRSLTDEEKSPRSKESEKLSRLVFQGSNEEVNQFFYKRGWTDGLPILSPTEEALREMLKGTDLPPDHLVAKIPPRFGKATVEKIAINAVMAGALPTYMPFLIAGVEALADKRTNFQSWGVSTGSFAPCWIINGPARKDINANSSSGVLSSGHIANTTIGRAMGLIIKNIGGVRKGIEDMSCLGNTGKYTMTIAENEEESPWEPLHVEQGFNKEDNAITLFMPYCHAVTFPFGTDDKGILNAAVYNIIPAESGLFMFLICPAIAKLLGEKGWTKKEIAEFISEYARKPAYQIAQYNALTVGPRMKAWSRVNREDTMRILRDPSWIRVVVAGGPGKFMGLHGGVVIDPFQDWVTKKVELPAKWDSLVKKYKNLVPTYVRY